MANFKEALHEGFEAAKKAEIARREVTDILETLRKDILEATDGKIIIELKRVERDYTPVEKILRVTSAASVFSAPGYVPDDKRRYWAITASRQSSNEEKPRIKELAQWDQGKDGYPCVISWGNQERHCQDREALEAVLVDLLRDPLTAERLNSLIR